MNRARLLVSACLLSLLSGLLGCDVAVVAYLASKGSSKSKNSSPPAPDVTFRLWVAELGAAAGSVQQGIIQGNNGDPDPGTWTQIAAATTSGEYTMPTPMSTGFNAILIQATDAQVYEIDAFEVIDATGTTTEVGAASTLFASTDVTQLTEAQGAPNGKGALTAATSTARSFVFFKRTAAITTFRINLWCLGAARVSGDVEWSQTLARASDQRAGGAAVNSLGATYLAFKEGNSLLMIRYDSNGNPIDQVPGPGQVTTLETTAASSGTASIAIDRSNDSVYVATSYDPGNIALYKFTGNGKFPVAGPIDSIGNAGLEFVEANSLILNSDKDLIVAGAADYGGLNGIGHYLRKHNTSASFNNLWSLTTPPSPPVDTTTNPRPTYWYAVGAFTDALGNRFIYPSGDLNTILTLGNEDAYSIKVSDNATAGNPTGAVTQVWSSQIQGSGGRPARGQAVGVDGNHNVYVAGFCTGTGLDSFIVTYDGGAAPTPAAVPFFSLTRTGNDEFLDIAVEADGTVYATGYETNGTQDEDLVLYKIAPNKSIVWKRTVNGTANLKDRGVKVIATPTHVMVVGELGVAAGNIDIHVRKYVK